MRQVKGRLRRGAARRPEPTAADSWMPTVKWRSPAMVGAGVFLALTFGAGLVQGGHLGFGGGGHRNAAGFSTDIGTLIGWLK